MKFECEDCGSVFGESEVKSWTDIIIVKDVSKHNPLCPFCGSKWMQD